MRNLPPLVMLVLALFFGGMAAFVAKKWITKPPPAPVAPTLATVQIIAAARDIPRGTVLADDQLKLVDWPQGSVPAGTFTDKKQLAERVNRYPLTVGELVLESKLAAQGARGGLSGVIQGDKRAITVKVDEASGVAGFIKPEDMVDVVVTWDKNEFKADPVSRIILQNLLVLGVGQEIEQKPGEKPKVVPTVTLEVTPEEGESLALAAKEGHITLALRPPVGDGKVETEGIRSSEMLGMASKAPVAASVEEEQAKPRTAVEVLRGTERETVNF